MLKKLYRIALLIGAFFHMEAHENGQKKAAVLCTTQLVADAVKAVAGDAVSIDILIQGEIDPHSYQLVKGDADRIQEADVVFCNGLNLEHGFSLKQMLSKHPAVVSLGDAVYEKFPQQILKVDGELDPHVWMDASLWAQTLDVVAKRLALILPEQEKLFYSKALEVQQRWLALDHEIAEKMGAIQENKRYLVTSHDAFNYFSRRYLATDEERKDQSWTKRFKAPEGLSPDSQIGPYDIKKILNHLTQHRIAVVFAESNVSVESLKKIIAVAKMQGVKVIFADEPLFGDSMTGERMKVENYEALMRHNCEVIAKYLNTYHPTS